MKPYGVLKVVSIDTPPAYTGGGTPPVDGDWGKAQVVPEGKVWCVRAIAARFITSAAVGNRTPVVSAFTAGGVRIDVGTTSAIIASKDSFIHMFGANNTQIRTVPTVQTALQLSLERDIWVPAGGYLYGTILSALAGDAWSDVFLTVTEYDADALPVTIPALPRDS